MLDTHKSLQIDLKPNKYLKNTVPSTPTPLYLSDLRMLDTARVDADKCVLYKCVLLFHLYKCVLYQCVLLHKSVLDKCVHLHKFVLYKCVL
jgi:hypothetical protein